MANKILVAYFFWLILVGCLLQSINTLSERLTAKGFDFERKISEFQPFDPKNREIGLFLYAKIISYEKGKEIRFCLGNFVSPSYILTGFNCKTVLRLSILSVLLSSKYITTFLEKEVKNILYNPNPGSSLALVKLYEPIKGIPTIQYISLPTFPVPPSFWNGEVVGLNNKVQIRSLKNSQIFSNQECRKYLDMALPLNTICVLNQKLISQDFYYDTVISEGTLFGTLWLYRYGLKSFFLFESVANSYEWILNTTRDETYSILA